MSRDAYVYILASQAHGTLYVGVTTDLKRRAYEHRNHLIDGFTKQRDVTNLVWFEVHTSVREAIAREKQLKHWQRQWKISLIEENNPQWLDQYFGI